MARWLSADRGAPIVAGLAGLAWFWAELAPQRAGFEDTDNPATGLAFVAAHPDAWVHAGLALAIAALALVVTVLAMRDRLEAAGRPQAGTVATRAIMVVGLFAAGMLLLMAAVRLAGGPLLYVQGLRQEWGEAAYLVTQFVGIQLFGVGGLTVLSAWIVAVAWLGVRRGAVPRLVAVLAVLPAVRLASVVALLGLPIEALWFVFMAAIPASFAWLVLLGAWPAARVATGRLAPEMAREVAPV
jgi:hypothetical protein